VKWEVEKAMATANPEFHAAIQLLLARMASNPEEFTHGHKWGAVLIRCLELAGPEEKAALDAAVREMNLEALHQEIMRLLVQEDDEQDADADTPKMQIFANRGQGKTGLMPSYESVMGINSLYGDAFNVNNQRRAVDLQAEREQEAFQKHMLARQEAVLAQQAQVYDNRLAEQLRNLAAQSPPPIFVTKVEETEVTPVAPAKRKSFWRR
jgi:hypothetical protein